MLSFPKLCTVLCQICLIALLVILSTLFETNIFDFHLNKYDYNY